MNKVTRFLAVCSISVVSAALSLASAQTITTVDLPGAVATTVNGGTNPQGTAVGSETDAAGITHGFTVDRNLNFTLIDPPGSTGTTPNFISPQGTIVGGYLDAVGVSHGFILSGGHYTTLDFPGAPGTQLTSITPTGVISGLRCDVASCGGRPRSRGSRWCSSSS